MGAWAKVWTLVVTQWMALQYGVGGFAQNRCLKGRSGTTEFTDITDSVSSSPVLQ